MNSRKPLRQLAVALMTLLIAFGGLALTSNAVEAQVSPSTDAADRAFFCDFRNQGLDPNGSGAQSRRRCGQVVGNLWP